MSNAVRYENKKINGTGQGPVVAAQPGQTPALANAQVAAVAAQAAAQVAQAGHQQAGQQATMTMKQQNSHSVRPQQIQVQPAQTGMNSKKPSKLNSNSISYPNFNFKFQFKKPSKLNSNS